MTDSAGSINDRSQSKDSFSSLLETVFIATIFGVIPLLLFSSWLMDHSEAECDKNRADLVQTMQFRASVFSRYSVPEEFLPRWISSWASRGCSPLREFLAHLERRFPGSIRGIAWDANGHLLDLPGPGFFKRNTWETIVKRYCLSPRPPTGLAAAIAEDPNAKPLQQILGKKVDLGQMLAMRNEARKSVWMEKDCFLVQVSLDPQKSVQGIAGGIFFVLSDAFPQDFLSRLGLRMCDRLFADGLTRLGFFPLVHPDQSGHASPPRFMQTQWWKRYRSRSEDVLSWGKRLILGLDQSLGCRWKAFLVADTSPLRRNAEREILLIRLAGVFTGLWILFFAWVRLSAPFATLSFRWRIAGYFALSLAAPTFLFSCLAVGLVDVETARSRQESFEKLKGAASLLQTRFEQYPGKYGIQLKTAFLHLQRRGPSANGFYALLDRWVSRGFISAYYGANKENRLGRVNDPMRGKAGIPLMQSVLQNGFANWRSEGLPEVTTDTPFRVESIDLLKRVTIGLAQTNIMMVRLIDRGELRLFILEVSEECLHRSFLRRWDFQRRQRQVNPNGKDQLVWEIHAPSLNPEHSDQLSRAMRHSQGFQGWSFSSDMQGAVEYNANWYFFYIPEIQPLVPIRQVLLLPQREHHQKRSERWAQVHHLIAVTLLSALVIGFSLAGSLLRPVLGLDRAVRTLRAGNLSIMLPEEGTNEISRLNRSFNEITAGLQQRERMRAFVSSSVLQAVAQERPSTGRRGEIREASVLFMHIHGFEELLRRFTPHEVFSMLNGFLAGAEPCIRRVGGEVDKFLGDALMAIFLQDGKEVAAVTAALALHEFVTQFNAERRQAGFFPIEIGIGINTGTVMMGDIGSSRRKDLTVIGDTVNLAARLESVSIHAKRTRIILSERTFAAVGHLVEAEQMGISQVKGKTERIQIFELVTIRQESGT